MLSIVIANVYNIVLPNNLLSNHFLDRDKNSELSIKLSEFRESRHPGILDVLYSHFLLINANFIIFAL